MYIDIHNHSLYGVDDGPAALQESVALLENMVRQHVRAAILTPHYRHGMFAYPKERVEAHFAQLYKEAQRIGLKIYLGCEYHADSDMLAMLQNGSCHTLADSDYVLTEYSGSTEYDDMKKSIGRLLSAGYIPVVAHAERYACLVSRPSRCEELSDMGAWIQLNAGAVLGLEGRTAERFTHKLLKHQTADVIASDTHDIKNRRCHMERCCQYVSNKYGTEYAEELFCENPGCILPDDK